MPKQDQESLLGWTTAMRAAPELAPIELVAWDSGGGSFQISGLAVGGIDSWMAAVGSSVAKAMLIDKVQGKSFQTCASPNPVTLAQAQSLSVLLKEAIGAPPGWLPRKVLVRTRRDSFRRH